MNDLEDANARSFGRAPNGRASRRYYGKYPGIVVDNVAREGAAHRGEVKVRVSGILEETLNGNDSQALEVFAAPSFLPGFFFVPAVEARVWVEFVAGDINFPIWTGVWYPEGATPADSNGAAPDEFKRILRTSAEKGRVVLLDDTPGSESLVLKDETNGNTVTMNADGITIEFGSSKVFLKDGTVELTQGGSAAVVLDGSNGVTVTDGTGAAQGAALAKLVDFIANHTHVGNLGAPTPLNPVQKLELTIPALKKTYVSTKS